MISTGSRFVDLLDDTDDVTDYVPRHLRAVTLSPDLQDALDRAFAPEAPGLDEPPARLAEPAPRLVEPVETTAPSRLVEPVETTAPSRLVEPVETPTPSRLVEPVEDERIIPELILLPSVPSSPSSPAPSSPSSPSFPDPARYARRSAGLSVDPALSAGIMGRFFRQKVDPSRLTVRTV